MRVFKLLFLLIFMSMATVLCASTVERKLVLDNYTIPLNIKGAKVGGFITPNNETVTLIEDVSGLFEVDKNGELILKKGKQITESSPMIYEITVEYGGKKKSFDIVKDEFIKNKVIAHRGAWRHPGVSQNTLGSLKHAIALGCQGSELDVWLTKDKRIALNHDADLYGKIVEKTDLADLQTIKLKNNEVVPTLEDYINLVKTQNKTRIVIELKSDKRNANILELAEASVQMVHDMKAQAWVDYITFDYRGLKIVRAMDATAHTAFLEPSVDLDLQKLDGMSGIDYHHTQFDKIEKLYERCIALGLTMNVWTVDTEDKLNHFLDLDLDFITTDEPEMLLKLIDERK